MLLAIDLLGNNLSSSVLNPVNHKVVSIMKSSNLKSDVIDSSLMCLNVVLQHLP